MARRFAPMLLGLFIGIIAGAVLATALSAASQAAPQQTATPQTGPAGPPAPCGPQAQLPENLSKNVDAKSRCFEIRIYTVDQSRVVTGNLKVGINELHQRFREKEVAIFQKHGAEVVGVWQHLGDPNTLVWMLAYRDRAHREDVWAKFSADPDWTALRNKYPVPVSANTFMMSASDYSQMK